MAGAERRGGKRGDHRQCCGRGYQNLGRNPVPLDLALGWTIVGCATSALGCSEGGHKAGKTEPLLFIDSWDRPRYDIKRGSLQSDVGAGGDYAKALPASSGAG